jgi:hypothetical protein
VDPVTAVNEKSIAVAADRPLARGDAAGAHQTRVVSLGTFGVVGQLAMEVRALSWIPADPA